MAEADLKKAIQEKIQKEREAFLNQARQEAEEILSQAKKEAATLEERHLTEIKKNCLLQKTKELNQIKLELKRQLLEAKEKKIFEVFSLVEDELKTIHRDIGQYKSIFRYIWLESQESFGEDVKLKLKVNPSDKELALEVIKDFKKNVQLETKGSIDAGLTLCDSEENRIILNTFSSRLDKLKTQLRQEVSKILFPEP